MSCWFWNIAVQDRKYFREELEHGRLRQGWGYDESLDLQLLKQKIVSGEDLSRAEQKAWDRCSPMLDRIKENDLVVVKNVPSRREFSITKVTGGYGFEIGEPGDYGHYLPVTQLAVFNKNAGLVPVPFARALNRERNPIRVTYKHEATVRSLVAADVPKEEATRPESLKERFEGLRENLAVELRNLFKERIDPAAAERLVLNMLHRDGLDTIYNAGAYERGADVLSEVDLGYGLTVGLAVQVKQHWGQDNDPTGIRQLIEASGEHGTEAGLLVTFADSLGPNLQKAIAEAQKEFNVEVIYGEDLYGRLLEMLADPHFEPTLPE